MKKRSIGNDGKETDLTATETIWGVVNTGMGKDTMVSR
jgi:hypothetical protein